MKSQSGEPLVAHGRVIAAPPGMGDGWAVVVTEPVFAVVFIGEHSWLQTDELVRVRFVPGERNIHGTILTAAVKQRVIEEEKEARELQMILIEEQKKGRRGG